MLDMTIRCANGHENPEGQQYCGGCGALIELPGSVTCPNSHENPAGQNFCGYCGAALPRVDTQHDERIHPDKAVLRAHERQARTAAHASGVSNSRHV